jgi:hypothetical protein
MYGYVYVYIRVHMCVVAVSRRIAVYTCALTRSLLTLTRSLLTCACTRVNVIQRYECVCMYVNVCVHVCMHMLGCTYRGIDVHTEAYMCVIDVHTEAYMCVCM